MFKYFIALFLATNAWAQQPNGVINAPIYATGYISQAGGTNVTTSIAPSANHPTNLNIYTTGGISTWTIKLPNPAFEGQILTFNCSATVGTVIVQSSDGSSVDNTLPTICAAGSGFATQFDQRSNIWRNITSSNTINQNNTVINASDYGITPGGADNSSRVNSLMLAVANPATPYYGGGEILFPKTVSTAPTYYYFSSEFQLTRPTTIKCQSTVPRNTGVALVFDAGVSGITWENAQTSNDGGAGDYARLEGCGVYSLGAGTATTTSGSTTVSNVNMETFGSIPATTWGVGDGIIVRDRLAYFSGVRGPITASGAYISGVAGTTLTLNASFPVTSTPLYGTVIYRLPAARMIPITTVTGSDTFTTTGGTVKIRPGDVIWSDAFPFGSVAGEVSGSVGAQTVKVYTSYYAGTITQTASVTHAAGSGKLWIVPAAFDLRNQARIEGVYGYNFPLGLKHICSSTGGLNCTVSYFNQVTYENAMIGKWVAGSNSGGSTDTASEGIHNHIDLFAAGSVADTYIGYNSNSSEEGDAPNAIIGGCFYGSPVNTFIGGYYGISVDQPFCTGTAGPFSVPVANLGGGPLSIGPIAGSWADATVFTRGQIKGQIDHTRTGTDPCLQTSNQTDSQFQYRLTKNCGTSGSIAWRWNSTTNMYEAFYGGSLVLTPMAFTTQFASGFLGDGSSYAMFPYGYMEGVAGSQRLVDYGTNTTVSYSGTYPRGSRRWNITPSVGGNALWANIADGSNLYPAAPISNSTTRADYTMQTIRSGLSSNTDLTGRVTLVAGTATYNLQGTYTSAPNCFAQDVTTPANAASVSETTTQLTFTGTGTDVIKYICAGRN